MSAHKTDHGASTRKGSRLDRCVHELGVRTSGAHERLFGEKRTYGPTEIAGLLAIRNGFFPQSEGSDESRGLKALDEGIRGFLGAEDKDTSCRRR